MAWSAYDSGSESNNCFTAEVACDVAGVMYGLSVFMMMDAIVWSDRHHGPNLAAYTLLTIIASLAMFALNLVPWVALQESHNDPRRPRAKCGMIFSTLVLVLFLLFCAYLFLANFVGTPHITAGVLFLLHALLLFGSAWMLRGLRMGQQSL